LLGWRHPLSALSYSTPYVQQRKNHDRHRSRVVCVVVLGILVMAALKCWLQEMLAKEIGLAWSRRRGGDAVAPRRRRGV